MIGGPMEPWSMVLGLVVGEAILLGHLWAMEMWERRARA